jgi:hypothetical protein
MAEQFKSIKTVRVHPDAVKSGDSSRSLAILLDGHHMTTLEECYAEFSAKIMFPDYFGANMNALYDMLTDLSWLSFRSLTLIIDKAYLLLIDGSVGDKEALLNLLESVADYWAKPINLGEVWDRSAIDFRTLLIE